MKDESFLKIEPIIKRSNSMFLHPSPDIDIKVIKQIGDYSLGTELGSGAFGKVVLGKHILTNELVAIKILDKMILSHTPDDYQSVKQEINILKSVKHKHIVQLYEVLQTSRHIFIIMEYCEGKDLLDYILTKSKLSEEESLKYFQQLINALFYLHSQNIAHRDIKIDNMLLDRNRDLKLVDFGLSTKYPDDNLLDQPCGTVVYAAPEVLQGREYHGMLADVWSSGIVLYGMLSGYLPFGEQDDEVNRQNIIMGRINYPSYFSDCVKDLLMHMLDLDPMTRYTLQEVRSHPWFNLLDYKLIPGIIIGYNIIPVDEKILNLCVTYNCDKEKVRESVINNKYNSDSALYYLLIKKLQKKGIHSVSDFYSDEFINFVLDDNNLVESQSKERNLNNKNQESEIKYNININANNNCSAPPDGKIRYKGENQEKNENNGMLKLITPKNSEKENIINKKINFDDETPKGALSFIINNPSFEETNRELFNIKYSNSNSNFNSNHNNINKLTNNNDNDSKKTNKNTSSDSKNKNVTFQVVNVNDFQITDKVSSDKSEQKILFQSILENKINSNNIFIDENNKTENENEIDYKLLNVFYKNTESNEKNEEEKGKELEIENKQNNENIIYKQNIDNPNNNESNNYNLTNNLNVSNNNNDIKNNDNSIEIIYDKSIDLKNRNNDDILETPIVNGREIDINEDNISENLINLDKNIKNEFIIETPPNNKNNNKDSNENKNISKNRNTLSKQKVYIDKNKTYSDKNNNEEKNKLDINKIKDIRKINLFQDEIKEEENNNKINIFQIEMNEGKNYKKIDEKILLSEITDRELNENLKKNTPRTKSKIELNDIRINNKHVTPNNSNHKEITLEQISLNKDSNNNKSFNKKDNNENIIFTDNIINKNLNDNLINTKDNNNVLNIDKQEINNNESLDNKNSNSQNLDNKNINKDIINNKIQNINLNNVIKEIKEENKNKLKENKNIEEIKEENKNIEEIKEEKKNIQESKEDNNNVEEIKEENKNIEQIKEENKNKKEIKEETKSLLPIKEENKNIEPIKEENKNIESIKEDNKKIEDKANSLMQKAAKKSKNNKVLKKKENKKIKIDNKKKKNPIINSIIKNYKAIIDNNNSIEKKNKKSTSKEKNNKMNTNYSTKNKLSKNKEKEIISIKVIINNNLVSKEKNKNNRSKNRTEQPEKKIKSIYRVNILPNNLSKIKYTTIKKPTMSIFKKKIMKNCYTNKNFIKNPKINSTHIKSSSIHIFGTMTKNYKCIKNNINNTTNNSNSLFKINKFKNNYVTSSRILNKNKKTIKTNYLLKSYNNKYMKLFKSTQYKNNKILFTNKIDKTNLNKKFDEIAHKINKSIKNNKNKIGEKKIPLWKYIQSDQHLNLNNNSNNKMISSSPHLGKKDIKKGATNKNQNINKNLRDKIITQNSFENKTNDNIHLDKNIKLKDHNFNVNINKLHNINNKSNSLSKNKNINVFFINIKNYINNKNNIKKANKKNIESSATNQRYRSPYEVRELSESVKNKYLNQKTRFNKLPWKVKKKAIDEKIEIGELYKYYMNKNKNPFKKNNNKINKKLYNNIRPIINKNNKKIESQSLLYLNKISGIKYSFNKKQKPNDNPINEKVNLKQYVNVILTNKKKENIKTTNKKFTQLYTPQYLHKKSYFQSLNHNINQRNIVPNKLFHSTNNNSEYKEKNNLLYKNYFYVFDLSCLYMKAENLNDCYQNLINKLIKKNIYFVQKQNKVIRCFKNGLCCEIEIVKMDQNNNNNENKNGKNVYCFKILGKNGTYLNKMFKNILLE